MLYACQKLSDGSRCRKTAVRIELGTRTLSTERIVVRVFQAGSRERDDIDLGGPRVAYVYLVH